ncbi:MAG: hypothetical protein ACD_15C00084G0016 [uncultured bacterium]|nr:MAG: hypothetical protein ACD_15C00084G0016 [uncultured bacterium]HCU70444.1 prolipoprotein diacylglyceryl transferase [Candidatus Moranbacteria bacterium]
MKEIIDYYQHIPLNIEPIAFTIGSFSVGWYSLMYIAAIGAVYRILSYRIKKDISPENRIHLQAKNIGNNKFSKKEIKRLMGDFLLISFTGALLGGRLGYVLLYNPFYYLEHPLEIISPYDFATGEFIGIYGMSYHGGLVGAVIAAYFFARKHKLNFRAWADFIVPAVPAGYFFGRIGNFLNLELYGRATDSWIGMYFPVAASFEYSLRFPSQLIEAFLEGIILFIILWSIRNNKKYEGHLLSFYIVGYGVARFLGEFFREPDEHIGFIFSFITLGQIFSILMILAGIGLCYFQKKRKIV